MRILERAKSYASEKNAMRAVEKVDPTALKRYRWVMITNEGRFTVCFTPSERDVQDCIWLLHTGCCAVAT